MFEMLGELMSMTMYYNAFDRMADLETEFYYGDNAPVMEFTGLMNDLANMSEELSATRGGIINGIGSYPLHGYAASYGNHSGWPETILRLMEEQDIADKLLDDDYLESISEFSKEGNQELVNCIRAAKTLTKKQMMKLIPAVSAYTMDFYKLLGVFECIDGLLKEIHEQNERHQRHLQKLQMTGEQNEES